MKVLITGADGFIGRNLQLHLSERKGIDVIRFTRDHDFAQLPALLQGTDFVFHLAGINRPQDPREFITGNVDLTQALCRAVVERSKASGKAIPVVYTSSTQAERDNPYGRSKRQAEEVLQEAASGGAFPLRILRLPNVFGKWCKPNYNSGVATFCHNIARGLPIEIHDPAAAVTLVYVDDVIEHFMDLLSSADSMDSGDPGLFATVVPQYTSTVGELVSQIQSFKDSRTTLMVGHVGTGLTRALYSTYMSYLPVDAFSYTVPQYADPRGVFVEMLRTPDAGQFSFFTAHPGITRGGHYHHTKTEKFLVIKGRARFKFRHMQSGHTHEIVSLGERPEIVETVPGWTHDVTNIGADEMVVMLWANETFDRSKPDTFACPV